MRREKEARKYCPRGQRAEYSDGSEGWFDGSEGWFSTASAAHEREPEVSAGAAGSATSVAFRGGDPHLWILMWTPNKLPANSGVFLRPPAPSDPCSGRKDAGMLAPFPSREAWQEPP